MSDTSKMAFFKSFRDEWYGTVYEFQHLRFKEKLWAKVIVSKDNKKYYIKFASLKFLGAFVHVEQNLERLEDIDSKIPEWLKNNIKQLYAAR